MDKGDDGDVAARGFGESRNSGENIKNTFIT
jgi:hypothetical protein